MNKQKSFIIINECLVYFFLNIYWFRSNCVFFAHFVASKKQETHPRANTEQKLTKIYGPQDE